MKSILIIGGSSDIGISLGQKLKNNGNNVILSYYKNPITITGINSYKCDVTSEKSIEEIIKYGIDLYKKIDVIINLQSISCDNSFLNKTKKEILKALRPEKEALKEQLIKCGAIKLPPFHRSKSKK